MSDPVLGICTIGDDQLSVKIVDGYFEPADEQSAIKLQRALEKESFRQLQASYARLEATVDRIEACLTAASGPLTRLSAIQALLIVQAEIVALRTSQAAEKPVGSGLFTVHPDYLKENQ